MGRQINAPEANNQVVSYIEPALETQLELVEVEPYDSWQKDQSLKTIRASNKDGNRRRPAIARLRPRRIGYDFLVVLEISAGEPPPMPWGHIMLAARDLELRTLRRHFQSLRATAFGKQSAIDGTNGVQLTIKPETMGKRPMFAVRSSAINSLRENHII